jgi:DNA-binding NarL/FixJ family response regulator
LPDSPLRIFIADEHDIVRRGMASLLSSHPGWEVCGEAGEGPEAVEKIAQLRPDIVLLDIGMPKMDGLDVTRKIIQSAPFPKVILLSVTDVEPLVREALQLGIRGLITKTYASVDLLPAVEMVQQGRTFFPPRITELIVQGYLKKDDGQKKKDELGSGNVNETELAAYRQRVKRWNRIRTAKYLTGVALLLITAAIAWYTDVQKSDSSREMIDKWIVRAGLKSPPPRTYDGNPDTKVWIDLHTALYYCPGSPFYGKTIKGRYAKQREAQASQFESASRKPCD